MRGYRPSALVLGAQLPIEPLTTGGPGHAIVGICLYCKGIRIRTHSSSEPDHGPEAHLALPPCRDPATLCGNARQYRAKSPATHSLPTSWDTFFNRIAGCEPWSSRTERAGCIAIAWAANWPGGRSQRVTLGYLTSFPECIMASTPSSLAKRRRPFLRLLLLTGAAFVAFALTLGSTSAFAGSPTQQTARPSPPENFTGGAVDTGTFMLSWTPSASAVRYELLNVTTKQTRFIEGPFDESVAHERWGGFQPDTPICFRLRLWSSAGSSLWVPADARGLCQRTPTDVQSLLSFPFPAMSEARVTNVLHGPTWSYVDDDSAEPKVRLSFTNGRSMKHGLDLGAGPGVDQYVGAVSAGQVVAVDRACHTVVIDAGSHWWVYLHLNPSRGLSRGDDVVKRTLLGTLITDHPSATCHKGELWGGSHLHLALAEESPSSPNEATYVSMLESSFCGHRLIELRGEVYFKGLTRAPEERFTVPLC